MLNKEDRWQARAAQDQDRRRAEQEQAQMANAVDGWGGYYEAEMVLARMNAQFVACQMQPHQRCEGCGQ